MRDRNADQIPLEAEEAWMRLHVKTRMLQSHDNSYVRATAKAAQLILNLSSAPKTGGGAEALATELKDALCQLPGRSCVYMDMTSCHIMIGAIAAERGSETETWFVKKLRPGVKTMQSRGWGDPFGFLERTFMADLDMLQQLRGLREGIMKDS